MQERQPRRIKKILSWAELSIGATSTLAFSWADLNLEAARKLSEGSPIGLAHILQVISEAGMSPQIFLGAITATGMLVTVDANLKLRRGERTSR